MYLSSLHLVLSAIVSHNKCCFILLCPLISISSNRFVPNSIPHNPGLAVKCKERNFIVCTFLVNRLYCFRLVDLLLAYKRSFRSNQGCWMLQLTTYIYSRTSKARTPIACLPWRIRICFRIFSSIFFFFFFFFLLFLLVALVGYDLWLWLVLDVFYSILKCAFTLQSGLWNEKCVASYTYVYE